MIRRPGRRYENATREGGVFDLLASPRGANHIPTLQGSMPFQAPKNRNGA